jgi:DNA-binding MarR family transcriptional regulator
MITALNARDRFVLQSLKRMAVHDPNIFRADIADATGFHPATVTRALRSLEKHGFLSISWAGPYRVMQIREAACQA